MAKKKDEEKKNLPSTTDFQWLYQPLEMTMIKGDLSPTAQSLLVELICNFQDEMKAQLKAKAERRQYTLFDDEVVPMTKVQLNRLGVEAYDYGKVESAVAELFNFVIKTSVKNEFGDEVDRYVRLFQVCEIPKKKLEYYSDMPDQERYNYKDGQRKRGYVAMQFTQELASKMLTINKSYTKFIREATRGWKCKYATKMIMIISSFRDLGAWTVKYDEFRRLFGFIKLVPKLNDKGKEIGYVEEECGYTNFSDMKRRVLDPTMQEIKAACEEGRPVDCYFEYEPIYTGGKKRGVPDSLLFKIYKSEFGKLIDSEKELAQENHEIEEFLIKNLKLSKMRAATLCSILDKGNRDGFKRKMVELHNYVADPKNKVNDIGGYCATSLQNYLSSLAESENLDKTPTHDNTTDAEIVGDLSKNVADAPEPQMMNPMWDAALIKMQLRMPSNIYNAIAGELQFESFENGVLLLSLKSNAFFQWLEGDEGIIIAVEHYTIYIEEIFEAFGKDTQIKYKQRKD